MSRLFDELRDHGRGFTRMINDPKLLVQFLTTIKQSHPEWNDGTLEMFRLEVVFAADWIKHGEIVYDLSHSLAAMFALTSTPEVDWDRVPHQAFVIKVPRSFLPINGVVMPEHSYVYANRHCALAVADWDTTARVAVKYGGRIGANYESVIQNPKLMRERAELRAAQLATAEFDVSSASMPDWMKTIPPEVIVEIARRAHQQEIADYLRSLEQHSDEVHGLAVIVARLVANTVTYVLSQPPQSVTRSKRLGVTLFNLQPPREVVVDRAFRDAAHDAIKAITSGSIVGVRRALAHHVRGHWRNQAVGAGRAERRPTWVRPHKRGDESMGSVVRRIEHIGAER